MYQNVSYFVLSRLNFFDEIQNTDLTQSIACVLNFIKVKQSSD